MLYQRFNEMVLSGCLQKVFGIGTRKHQVAKLEGRRLLPKRIGPLWRMKDDSLGAVIATK